jgi:hypothetical protein
MLLFIDRFREFTFEIPDYENAISEEVIPE